jgi:HAD superfamily hydrolase (TIGR01509 family)
VGLVYDESDFKARFMGLSDPAFFGALNDDHVARFGRDLPEGFRDLCKARYRAAWPRIAEVPGARAAVSQIAHPKAVASSSTVEGLARKLNQTGLWEMFDPHVYSAEHVTHAKPAPDLFLHAARALALAPARCLVLEDSVNGVMAARAAGMEVWGFLGGGHMDASCGTRLLDAGAQRLIADWTEAAAAIGK